MEYIRRTHEEAFRIWKNFRFPVDQRTKPSEFLASPCERIKAEAQNGQSDQVKFDVPESGNVNATNSSKDASHRQRNRFRCLFRNLFPANTDTGPPNQVGDLVVIFFFCLKMTGEAHCARSFRSKS